MINLFLVFRYNVMHQKFWETENIEKKNYRVKKCQLGKNGNYLRNRMWNM